MIAAPTLHKKRHNLMDNPTVPDDITVCLVLWLAFPIIVYAYNFAGV